VHVINLAVCLNHRLAIGEKLSGQNCLNFVPLLVGSHATEVEFQVWRRQSRYIHEDSSTPLSSVPCSMHVAYLTYPDKSALKHANEGHMFRVT